MLYQKDNRATPSLLSDKELKNLLRELSALSPAKWQISLGDLLAVEKYLSLRFDQNSLESKHVLQAGMAFFWLHTKTIGHWLRGGQIEKNIFDALNNLKKIALSKNFNDKISKGYVFCASPQEIYKKNLSSIEGGLDIELIIYKKQHSPETLKKYGSKILSEIYAMQDIRFEHLPNKAVDFLASYLSLLESRENLEPHHVLLAGILLNAKVDFNNVASELSSDCMKKLSDVAIYEKISLQQLLLDEDITRIFDNHANQVVSHMHLLIKQLFVKDKVVADFVDLINYINKDSGYKFSEQTAVIMLNFMLQTNLYTYLNREQKNLFVLIVVYLASKFYHKEISMKFLSWVCNYLTTAKCEESCSLLVKEIDKKMPELGIDDLIIREIKENLNHLYTNSVVMFLHDKEKLSDNPYPKDCYFNSATLNSFNVERKDLQSWRVRTSLKYSSTISKNNSIDLTEFARIAIKRAVDYAGEVVRFNLSAILKIPNVEGLYKYGALYFSIKEVSSGLVIYSPNLPSAPILMKDSKNILQSSSYNSDKNLEQISIFLLDIVRTISKKPKLVIELQPVEYTLNLMAQRRSMTPMFEKTRTFSDNETDMVRSQSAPPAKQECYKNIF